MTPRHAVRAVLLVLVALSALAATPAAAATGHVGLQATVNGQSVAGASTSHPVRLDPGQPARVRLIVANGSAHPVHVTQVRLAGHTAGLTFYAFYTSVSITVAPGQVQTLGYSLDLTGLRGQATGLIGGTLALLNAHGVSVVTISTVTDVRGSILSVYGLFGLALLILTILALLDNALAIARHRMPANRWRRALRVMTPGIGIGLILVFTLSAARVWVPTAAKWWLGAAIFAAIFFGLGYLTPTPVTDDDLPEDDDDLAEPAEAVYVYPAPPSFVPPPPPASPPPGPSPSVLP